MANVRAPNRDFTLGTPGNRIQMSSPVNPTAGVVAAPSARNPIASPQPSAPAASGNGTQSFPIMG